MTLLMVQMRPTEAIAFEVEQGPLPQPFVAFGIRPVLL